MEDVDRNRSRFRSKQGLTAGQLDRRSEIARHLNNGEQKLLKTTLGRLESNEKKSVKLLRRTTEDLKKTLHELNMAGHSIKVWMDLEGRSAAAETRASNNGSGCHRSPFSSVDQNGGNGHLTSPSEYSRYRLPRIGSAVAGCRRNIANGAGPRRYSENDLALASKLLQLKLKNGEASVSEEFPCSETNSYSESPPLERSRGVKNLPASPGSRSPKILGDKLPGRLAWQQGSVYKTDSPRDSPHASPRDSPRSSPKLLPRSSEILHRSVSTESLGMKSVSTVSLGELSVDVTMTPHSPVEQRKNLCPSLLNSPKSQRGSSANSHLTEEQNGRLNSERPDTPSYPPRPPLSPRIPIPNIKIVQSGRMQPVLEFADIDPLVPTSPCALPTPSPSTPASEWRAEKPLRDARRKMLLNLPATFAALSRRRHSSPESQDEAVKICRERFSEMLDRRRASEQSELQAKVREFLERTVSSSSSNSSSEPAIDG